jgi:hypothetical protein
MGYGDLPESFDVDRSYEPWPEYDAQSEDEILAKLERKTHAIREGLSYDEIEDATAAAASVVNHERQKPEDERRQAILEQAYSSWRAGMTAN